MSSTKLLYLENFSLLECESKILEILSENGRDILILDQTVFYPQGGGQPYDIGIIESANGKFVVEEVRFADEIVKHIGHFEDNSELGNQVSTWKRGFQVRCYVDKNRRLLHSKIHSAGHLVAWACAKLNLPWIPDPRGYHYPNGPYVSYVGKLEGVDKAKLKQDLETMCNDAIGEGRDVTIRFTLPPSQISHNLATETKDTFNSLQRSRMFLKKVGGFMTENEMREISRSSPQDIAAGQRARMIFFGKFGVPCGGTHVKNISEIVRLTIRKIKQEGESIRVGYEVTK